VQSIPTCVSVSKMMRSIEVRSNLDNSPVNQEEFPTPAGRCPVPDWCGMSALWVGRCWSVSTSSWLFGTGWAGEILGSGGWYSGPCIVGGENVGNKRLVIWCQTRRMKKKKGAEQLEILDEDIRICGSVAGLPSHKALQCDISGCRKFESSGILRLGYCHKVTGISKDSKAFVFKGKQCQLTH